MVSNVKMKENIKIKKKSNKKIDKNKLREQPQKREKNTKTSSQRTGKRKSQTKLDSSNSQIKRKKVTENKRNPKKKISQIENKKEKSKSKKVLAKQNQKLKSRKKTIKKRRKILFVICNSLFYIMMLLIFTGSLLLAVMQQQDKSLFGYRAFGVLTNSMVSPDNTLKTNGFRSGDVVIVKESPPKELKVGDVITYRPSINPANKSTNNLTHRVVEINNKLGNQEGLFFTTRGDANKTNDMPISSAAIVGRVVYILPKIGGLLFFIKENWILSLVFIVSILGFIWVVRSYILTTTKNVSTKKGVLPHQRML